MSRELLRAIAARYRNAGRWTRFHVAGRLRSCPIKPVLEALPRQGLIASLGCGHGAFEIGMALDAPGREILGADVDAAKLAHARAAAGGLAVSFHHGDLFGAVAARGRAPAAIVIMDVLYLIRPDGQESILRAAFAALAPGGVLVIKEMDRRPAWKWWWNRAQEFLACRVLRFTRNETGVVGLRPAESWAAALAAAGFASIETRPVHRGFPHPHLLVLGRKPAGR